jgi:hypothetical protein
LLLVLELESALVDTDDRFDELSGLLNRLLGFANIAEFVSMRYGVTFLIYVFCILLDLAKNWPRR